VLYSLVAGVGITAAFGFVLLGGVRARERYDAGQLAQAVVYGMLAVAGLAPSATRIILGLIAISDT
jgi:hypothetical protein